MLHISTRIGSNTCSDLSVGHMIKQWKTAQLFLRLSFTFQFLTHLNTGDNEYLASCYPDQVCETICALIHAPGAQQQENLNT